MSKRYEQFQSLDQEGKKQPTVVPPSSGSAPDAPAPRDPSAKSPVLPKILCLAFVLLVVLLAVGGIIGAKFLKENESELRAAAAKRQDASRLPPSPPVRPPPERLPPKVEVDAVATYADGQVQGPPSSESPASPASVTTLETDTGNGKFITAIEVVTEVNGEARKAVEDGVKPSVPGSDTKPPVAVNVIKKGSLGESVSVALPDTPISVKVDIKRRTEPVDRTAEKRVAEDAPEAPAQAESVVFVRDFDRAVSLQRAGELDQALEYYGRYLERRPGHAGSYNNMGVIHQAKQEYARAVKAYSDAIAAEPDNHRTYNNLASCYMAQGEPSRAVEALFRSLALEEDNLPGLINMGVAQTALDDFRSAERFLNRAMERYPDEPRTVYNLGNLYRWRGEKERAAEYYQSFLEKSAGKYAPQEKQVRRYLKKLGRAE